MSYKVSTIAPFRREVKKLVKKYPSLKSSLEELGRQLSTDPKTGVALGNNCYKIRLAIADKKKREVWWRESHYTFLCCPRNSISAIYLR